MSLVRERIGDKGVPLSFPPIIATIARFIRQYALGIAVVVTIAVLAYLADWLTSGIPALLGQ